MIEYRVLANLLDNAIRHTPAGGRIELGHKVEPHGQSPWHRCLRQRGGILSEPTGRARGASRRVDEKYLTIYVKDTGPGIPDEIKSKIFERGTQAEGETKGTAGLGLYNVRKAIEEHKGNLRVESGIKDGTTFSFTLPLAKKE